jgi:hypothetical protein
MEGWTQTVQWCKQLEQRAAVHAAALFFSRKPLDNITPAIQRLAIHVIHIPDLLDEFATPLFYILPIHIFGYEMALQRGWGSNCTRYDIVPQNVRYQENKWNKKSPSETFYPSGGRT